MVHAYIDSIRLIMNMVLWLPLVLHNGGTAPATDHTTSPKQREISAGHWLQAFQQSFNAVHLDIQHLFLAY